MADLGQRTIIPGDEIAIDFTTATITYRSQTFRFPALGSVPQALVAAGGAENLVARRLGLQAAGKTLQTAAV